MTTPPDLRPWQAAAAWVRAQLAELRRIEDATAPPNRFAAIRRRLDRDDTEETP